MLFLLPIAAVLALFVAAKGRPWHAVIGLTLGVYLFRAALALTLHGTGGFMHEVEQPSWWIPASVFGALALMTGSPALRRVLFGRKLAHRLAERAKVQTSPADESQAPLESLLHETGGWDEAVQSVASLERLSGAELLRDASSLEHRTTGPLGETTRRVNAGLEILNEVSIAPGEPLRQEWYETIHEFREGHATHSGLSGRDRTELVARAASFSLDAGQTLAAALPVQPSASLRGLVAELGSSAQQSPAFGDQFGAPGATALGWSGFTRASGRVTEENHGRGPVEGLRLRFQSSGIVGIPAASWVLLDVDTFDSNDVLIGRSAVLVPTEAVRAGKNKGKGKGSAEQRLKRQASTPVVGDLAGDEVFVPLRQVLGEGEGVGTAGPALDRARNHYAATRCALFAGASQRALALRGAEAIAMNVMHGATIEAWGHAMSGAAAWKLNALAESMALVGEERPLTRFEADNATVAAARIAAELTEAPGEAEAAEEGAQPNRSSTHPSDAAVHAMAQRLLIARLPKGVRTASMIAEAAAGTPAELEHASSDGLRAACSSWAWLTKNRLLAKLPGRREAAEFDAASAGDQLIAALTAISSLAGREPASPTSSGSQAALQRASHHVFTAMVIAWTDLKRDRQSIERDIVEFALAGEFECATRELAAAASGLKSGLSRAVANGCVRALRKTALGLTPELAERVAAAMIANPEILLRLTRFAFRSDNSGSEISRVHAVAKLSSASRVPAAAIRRAQSVGQLPDGDFSDALDLAVERRIVSSVDATRIRACTAAMENLWALDQATSRRISA